MKSRSVSAFYGRTDPVHGVHLGLRLHGENASINIGRDFHQIEKEIGVLPSVLRDLIDVASATYVADLLTAADSPFSRRLDFTIEVRDLEVWTSVADLLSRALSFLMQSSVRFSFTQGPHPQSGTEEKPMKTYESVACLSGGLDSFIGARTQKDGGSTLFVSQYNGPQRSLQRKVYEILSMPESCSHLPIFVRQNRRLGRQTYYVQPSRSFLYLALAGALAIRTDASTIFMFENGPMAIGIPYTPARFHTRTVHPIFLDMMQTILQSITGENSVSLLNPFGTLTKAEDLEKIPDSDLGLGLKETCSCSQGSRVNLRRKTLGRPEFIGRHCGFCLPCIHRRLSVLGSLRQETNQYLVDILKEYPFTGIDGTIATEALVNVRDLMVFAGRLKNEDDNTLYERFPDLYFETDRIAPGEILRMHRRFAAQMLETLEECGNQRLRQDVGRIG